MTVNILAAEALLAAPEAFKVIDARRRNEFESVHIPDAISMEWEDWCDPAPVAPDTVLNERGYWGVLKSAPEDWYAERLGACGLSSADPIV
ncbi:MAG TPA: rhodanese-like domain-containing protein, partial [Candidatus Dormibacteraeota bacterium]